MNISNTYPLLPSMPGISLSLTVGVCDAFGQEIRTVVGGTILYSWRNVSSSSLDVVRTSSNGTGELSTRIPVLEHRGLWHTLHTQWLGQGFSPMPLLSFIWKSSPCMAFYGYSPIAGCSLCSPSQYSIAPSFLSCVSCQDLSFGATCSSVPYSLLHLPRSLWPKDSMFDPMSTTVTAVKLDHGFWPALSSSLLPSAPFTVVPISCPFLFCSRSADLFVTGVDSTHTQVTVSDPSILCQSGAHRDPTSPLCGKCEDGYAQWNFQCYRCPDGPAPENIAFYVLFMFAWTIIQLILAQQGSSGSVTAMLFLLTQSLTWFTYPRGVVQNLEDLVNFRFHFSASNVCFIDVDGSVELFLRVLLPMLYFAVLWVLYMVHMIIAWCLSRSHAISATDTAASFGLQSRCKRFLAFVSNFIVSNATTDPYLRTTALLLLSTFPSILESIFSVWTCLDVPVWMNQGKEREREKFLFTSHVLPNLFFFFAIAARHVFPF